MDEALRILNLSLPLPDAKTIRAHYVKRARACHPDAGGTDTDFHELQEAYDTVCKCKASASESASATVMHVVKRAMEWIGVPTSATADVRRPIHLTEAEAENGKKDVRLVIEFWQACQACNGRNDDEKRCAQCEGSGREFVSSTANFCIPPETRENDVLYRACGVVLFATITFEQNRALPPPPPSSPSRQKVFEITINFAESIVGFQRRMPLPNADRGKALLCFPHHPARQLRAGDVYEDRERNVEVRIGRVGKLPRLTATQRAAIRAVAGIELEKPDDNRIQMMHARTDRDRDENRGEQCTIS